MIGKPILLNDYFVDVNKIKYIRRNDKTFILTIYFTEKDTLTIQFSNASNYYAAINQIVPNFYRIEL